MIGLMFRLDVTSAERPHRPEGGDDIIEGSKAGHRVGPRHQGASEFIPCEGK
jgi:hypothetical protein